MDSLKRHTSQHQEYEPEWETSFNLLIKLQKSISNLIEWSASDREVFIQCFLLLLELLRQVETEDESIFDYKYEKIKFNGQQYEIIDYQVIKQEVSIHAPLSRILAAFYPHMKKFGLNYNSLWEIL